VRVLTYWNDRVPNALDLVKKATADESPRVRLEALRACSFFTDPKALEVALEVLNKEADPEKPEPAIKYLLDEVVKTLEKHAK
jgi:HEAT repeat protein